MPRLAFLGLVLAALLQASGASATIVAHAGFDGADIALMSHSVETPRFMPPRRSTFGIVGPGTGMAPALADDTMAAVSGARRWQIRRHLALGIYGRPEHDSHGHVFGAAGLRNARGRPGRAPAALRLDFAFGRVVSLHRLTIDMAAMGRFRRGDHVQLTIMLDGTPWMSAMMLTADPRASFTYSALDDGRQTTLDAPLVDAEGQPLDNTFATLVLGLAGAEASTASLIFEMVMGGSRSALALDNITLEAFGEVPLPASLLLLGSAIALIGRYRPRC